jgi:hypothetical protein
MTPELKNLFDGLLISDGSYIQTSKVSAHFSMGVHARNEDWIMSITDQFKINHIEYTVRKYPGKVRISKGSIINQGPNIRIYTFSYRNLLPERQRWYPNGIKIVPRDIELTPLVMAGWLMGDGSNSLPRPHNTHVTLHTNGFTYEDVQFLSQKLSEIGIIANIVNGKKSYQFTLNMTRLNAEKYIHMVENLVTPSFKYKTRIDPWYPPKCKKCGVVIENSNNYDKYCDQCIPQSVKNLRRSRANNESFELLRKARRAIVRGDYTETDLEIIKNHEVKMQQREIAAQKVKDRLKINGEKIRLEISKHQWPSRQRMAEWVELTSLSEIAKTVKVSIRSISLKCMQWGIKAKPPYYWSHRPRLKAAELN